MRAIYWSCPTAAELAQLNLKAKHFKEPHVEVWECHWDVLHLFRRLSSQWRIGFGGPTGLDYNVFFHELTRAGIAGEAFDEAMESLRVIEQVALDEIHKD